MEPGQRDEPEEKKEQSKAAPTQKQATKKRVGDPRGRGRRGRKGNVDNSSILAKAGSGVSVIHEPERTYYLVNFPALLAFFISFDTTMRTMSRRRPGHPVVREYAAICLWALLGKLARVGAETNQLILPSNQFPRSEHVKLPGVISGLISSIGEFTDTSNEVVVAPRVTTQLLGYIYRTLLMLLNVQQADAYANPGMHKSFYRVAYGPGVWCAMVMNDMLLRAGTRVRYRYSSNQQADLRRSAGLCMLEIASLSNNISPNLNINTVLNLGIDDWGTLADTWANDAVSIFANVAPITAFKNASVARYTNDAGMVFLPAGAALPELTAIYPTVGNASIYTSISTVQYVSTLVPTSSPSVEAAGTCSPTCVSEPSGSGFTVSSQCMSMNVNTAILGAVLMQRQVVWTDTAGICYSFHGLSQNVRTSTTPIRESLQTLQIHAIREGLSPTLY